MKKYYSLYAAAVILAITVLSWISMFDASSDAGHGARYGRGYSGGGSYSGGGHK